MGIPGKLDFPMRILSWNVRGLGPKQKRCLIKDSISRRDPDVLCLREIKIPLFKDSLLTSLWKAKDINWATLNALGTSGGIVVVWKSSKWDLVSSAIGSFSVSVILQDKSSTFSYLISVVYGPNDDHIRVDFWEELSNIKQSFSGPYCFVGDFNVIRFVEEHSRIRRVSPAMERFSDWIQALKLVDLPLSGARFTWTNGRCNPLQSRLDRFLMSADWLELFPLASQLALPRTTSDHCPILLTLDDSDGFAGHKLLCKLRLLREKLKNWKTCELGKREAEMNDLLDQLHRIDLEVKVTPMSLDTLGVQIEDRKEIAKLAINHFRSLLCFEGWIRPRLDFVQFKSLNEAEVNILEAPFSEEEVKAVVDSLGRGKSPSPDGFPMAFFQTFWEAIQPNMMEFMAEFHARGRLSKGLRALFID
ncbi:uncharacterized protein LOC131224965 [Magnolia sinica]|uniref:uncharacterized protein LOC131224965 n=1 Tax=Magnolia sinica TaxID=86752 RepID=UPI00265800B5|nr:uncharacterized protein LOC131224965 [Magnolia sinica]